MTLATIDAGMLEKVVIGGDLAQLSPQERLGYYRNVCDSLGLNPLTKPFQYIKLSGKLTLYATKDATEQLARIHEISVELVPHEVIDDVCIVRAHASMGRRTTDATGAVFIGNLQGENKANAFMKAETKASRRAVLRLVGLGWLDETEVETVPSAHVVEVNDETGEIAGALPAGIDFAVSEFKAWLNEAGITPEELMAVTVPEPTKRNLIEWAAERNISDYYGMQQAIVDRVDERREARNEDLTESTQQELTGAEPNPNLPSKAMEG